MAGTIALEQLETYFDEALTANDEEMLVTAIAEADRVARLMRVSDHIGHKSKQVPPATCRCGGNQVLWQVLLLWRRRLFCDLLLLRTSELYTALMSDNIQKKGKAIRCENRSLKVRSFGRSC